MQGHVNTMAKSIVYRVFPSGGGCAPRAASMLREEGEGCVTCLRLFAFVVRLHIKRFTIEYLTLVGHRPWCNTRIRIVKEMESQC
jgi:hypothetical protein